MDIGVALGLVGVVVALAVPVLIDWAKRPRLRIRASHWSASGPMGHSFAVVKVHNDARGWLSRMFSQETASGCRVFADFRLAGTAQIVQQKVQLGWSHKPEPVNTVAVTGAGGVAHTQLLFAMERTHTRPHLGGHPVRRRRLRSRGRDPVHRWQRVRIRAMVVRLRPAEPGLAPRPRHV
jgi:hypothetical protein